MLFLVILRFIFILTLSSIFIIGILKDIYFWIHPNIKRINYVFIVKENFDPNDDSKTIHTIITFISIIANLVYNIKHPSKTFFVSQLKQFYRKLETKEGDIFVTNTHDNIINSLINQENKGNINIINVRPLNKRYLYETLKPPFKKVQFYEITFKILSKK